MTDTATMWRVTPISMESYSLGSWWHRSPAKKTTGKKEQRPHEELFDEELKRSFLHFTPRNMSQTRW